MFLKTSSQLSILFCLNNFTVSYQKVFSPIKPHLQSGYFFRAQKVLHSRAPAKCTNAVSHVIIRSKFFITAAASINAWL